MRQRIAKSCGDARCGFGWNDIAIRVDDIHLRAAFAELSRNYVARDFSTRDQDAGAGELFRSECFGKRFGDIAPGDERNLESIRFGGFARGGAYYGNARAEGRGIAKLRGECVDGIGAREDDPIVLVIMLVNNAHSFAQGRGITRWPDADERKHYYVCTSGAKRRPQFFRLVGGARDYDIDASKVGRHGEIVACGRETSAGARASSPLEITTVYSYERERFREPYAP